MTDLRDFGTTAMQTSTSFNCRGTNVEARFRNSSGVNYDINAVALNVNQLEPLRASPMISLR